MVTVSLGVAAFVPDKERQADDLVRLADQALYAAKDAGRNRIEIAVAPGAQPADAPST